MAGPIERVKRAFAELKGEPYSKDAVSAHGVITPQQREGEARGIQRGLDEEQIFDLVKKSPEALSLMQAIVDDVIGGDANFKYLGETSGERATEAAENFWRMKTKEEAADALMDALLIGDFYLYKKMLSESRVKSEIEKRYSHRFNSRSAGKLAATEIKSELKSNNGQYIDPGLKADEDVFKPSDVKMVPSSTVEHIIDDHGDIEVFYQSVGTKDTTIQPEKMVHMSYMSLNDRSYGFTPMLSIITELTMLANAKDHNGVKFDNAGVVNKFVKLKDEGPDSKNYQLIKQTMKKFRKMENKYHDLVVTGDVEIEDLQTVGQNMDFRELAEYITRVVVMAWGVPPTRVGMSIGGESGARVTSLTHQGYFRRIKRLQDKLETVLNSQLFEPHFNCHIEFDDPDVQTAIKKADKELRETDVALKRMAAGVWSREEAMDYLGVGESEVADLDDEEDQAIMRMAAQVASGRDQQLSELEVFGARPDEEMAEDQRQAREDTG